MYTEFVDFRCMFRFEYSVFLCMHIAISEPLETCHSGLDIAWSSREDMRMFMGFIAFRLHFRQQKSCVDT